MKKDGVRIMEFICPVCNGFEQLVARCTVCGETVEDLGRMMDYYDDYSAYMSIDQMKLEDGLLDYRNHLCPHYIVCSSCGKEAIVMIKE